MSGQFGHQESVGITGRVQDGMYASSADGVRAAMSKMGAIITQDQLTQWAIDGRMFHAQMGDAHTKKVFVEVAYDEDQPQWALDVPVGKTVIPTSLVLNLEVQVTTANHITWSTMSVSIGAGTSVETSITPMRTDQPFQSGCTSRELYTGNGATPANVIEFCRFLDMFAAVSTGPVPRYEWNIRTAGAVPILVGPATLFLHGISGTDVEGYMEAVWAEFDTPAVVTPT